jgi:hypothetical protein
MAQIAIDMAQIALGTCVFFSDILIKRRFLALFAKNAESRLPQRCWAFELRANNDGRMRAFGLQAAWHGLQGMCR